MTKFVLKPAGFKNPVFPKSRTKRLRTLRAHCTHTGVFTYCGWLGLNTWHWGSSIYWEYSSKCSPWKTICKNILGFLIVSSHRLVEPKRLPQHVSTEQSGVWELSDLRKLPVQFNRKRRLISQNNRKHLCRCAWTFSLVLMICQLNCGFLLCNSLILTYLLIF